MDQGDFDFNVFLDRKNNNKDKYKDSLLTKDELSKAVEILKKEGIDKYEILTINPAAIKKFKLYKRMLLFVNLPIMIALPLWCEFGIDFTHPKANMLYALLYTADTFLFANFFMILNMLKQAVVSINYLTNEDKFEINHFINPSIIKSLFSKQNKSDDKSNSDHTQSVGHREIVGSSALAKSGKGMFNPFIGYRNIEKDQKYITEGMCTWHDRHLFDSIIERAKEIRMEKVSEQVSKNRSKRSSHGNPFS